MRSDEVLVRAFASPEPRRLGSARCRKESASMPTKAIVVGFVLSNVLGGVGCSKPEGRTRQPVGTVGTVEPSTAAMPTAKAVRGASPYVAVENEPAPKLIVEPPLPGPSGVVWIQYRVENLHIVPVFGKGALN